MHVFQDKNIIYPAMFLNLIRKFFSSEFSCYFYKSFEKLSIFCFAVSMGARPDPLIVICITARSNSSKFIIFGHDYAVLIENNQTLTVCILVRKVTSFQFANLTG